MAEQKISSPLPVGPMEVKSENHRDIYANFSRAGMSPWDISLLFGTINDGRPGEAQSVSAEATIRMSPQQFKALATSLPLILTQWETTFGQINLPAQFIMSPEILERAFAAHKKALFPSPEAAKEAPKKVSRAKAKASPTS
jgi:hypothetical protein